MSDYPYAFRATLEKRDFGRMFYTVVYLPSKVAASIDFSVAKRVRINGEIDGIRIEAALMPTGGRWYLMVAKAMQRTIAKGLGDSVRVEFEIADPDAITVPSEMQFALDADDTAKAAWDACTAGKRRGWCYRIASARRPETRERRVEEILDLLRQSS